MISIIIPCHNDRKHLELLLKSIKDNSYYETHELVIVADKPSKDTLDYLVNNQSKFHVVDFGDLYLNWNYAAHIAVNDIICFLTADCVVGKNWDQKMLDYLRPDNVVSCYTISGDEDESDFWGERLLFFDCGSYIEDFDLEKFYSFSEKLNNNLGCDHHAWYVPLVVYKKLFLEVVKGWCTFEKHPAAMDDKTFGKMKLKGIQIVRTLNAGVYHSL